MDTPRPAPFIKSALFCIAASLVAGVFMNALLFLIILLLSNHAGAAESGSPVTETTAYISNTADVGQGTLFFAGNRDYMPSPAVTTDVYITINGMIARVNVKQVFTNPTQDWQEGIYVFPLPELAAVDHMKLFVGERIIEGEIRERLQARRLYNQARQTGRKTGLIEQERPNIFTTSVANIGPHEKITVEIEYQQTIDYDLGSFTLRFPMVVGARYIPGNTLIGSFGGTGWAVNTDQVPDAKRITPPVSIPSREQVNPVSIRIDLNAGFRLAGIDSAYHPVSIEEHANWQYSITLQPGVIPADRDFVLAWQPELTGMPQAALFTESKDADIYTLLMLLPPDNNDSEILNREIIFVIDTSGSMAGQSIIQARAALELALSRLKRGDSFNIIQFNSVMDSLFQSPMPTSPETLGHAVEYVNTLNARGGTEMAPALRTALAQAKTDRGISQVVFLTDGSVGNEDALFQIIKNKLANTRLFTIGIGTAPNSYFMRRAAEFGRGTHTYIGKTAEVQEKMNALLSKLESPVLSDITIDWPRNGNYEIWPQNPPDLYQGEPLLITARSDSLPERIGVSGKMAGSDWHAGLRLQGGQEKTGLHVLWARRKIASLTQQMHDSSEAESIRTEIINTALSHHLVSNFTSLVAVDITPARAQTVHLKQHAIPAQLPQGWEYSSVFGNHMPSTATSAPLDFVIGFILLVSSLLLFMTGKHVFHV